MTLIFNLDTPCTAFLEYVVKTTQNSMQGGDPELNEESVIKLVNACYYTESGVSAIDEIKGERDYGIYLGALFRECMNPITNVIFLDIDDELPYNEALRRSRHWTCDRQTVEIKPISSLDLTHVSVGLANNNLKTPLLNYLKKYYLVNGSEVKSYKDIDYATMTVIWSQINQLIMLAPKYKKSYGSKGNSESTAPPTSQT